jgi:hypothetical protein
METKMAITLFEKITGNNGKKALAEVSTPMV